jgi:hypothetical protein
MNVSQGEEKLDQGKLPGLLELKYDTIIVMRNWGQVHNS